MKQYIDKSALVAEIDRRNVICKKVALDLRTQENKDYYQGKAEAYKEMLDILNTLEVKEADLEDDVDKILEANNWNFDKIDFYQFAKHFFELGLKAQKRSKV